MNHTRDPFIPIPVRIAGHSNQAELRVLQARRTADDRILLMEKAYLDPGSGRTCCCWQADSREHLEALFRRAAVPFDSLAPVTEVLEADFDERPPTNS